MPLNIIRKIKLRYGDKYIPPSKYKKIKIFSEAEGKNFTDTEDEAYSYLIREALINKDRNKKYLYEIDNITQTIIAEPVNEHLEICIKLGGVAVFSKTKP